jgi:hypothetical protein
VAITTSFSWEELREAKADYLVRNFIELASRLGLAVDDTGLKQVVIPNQS